MVAEFPKTPQLTLRGLHHMYTHTHIQKREHFFMLKKDHHRADVPSVAVQHNVFQFTFIMLYQLNMV